MYISSDTNIWFDFEAIGRIQDPFRLPHEYYISDLTLAKEMQESKIIETIIKEQQLIVTTVTSLEMELAINFRQKYPVLSVYDAIALAVAKNRGWILLSGDRRLVSAARSEGVKSHGTLWIYDELYQTGIIDADEYHAVMHMLADAVLHGGRRLPLNEIKKRIHE